MERKAADPKNLDKANKSKPHLGVVIVGHVDAGKSTTTGHLLFELGTMEDRVKEDLVKKATEMGKASFAFAFFMDKQKEERERGVTISCTTKEFHTTNFHYTVIDAPGHKDFIKNMISGASQADVCLLMVPAKKGGFEAAIQKGDGSADAQKGQTRHHAELTALLGIKQMIIGVNKMDEKSVQYDQGRYKEIKKNMLKMVEKAGWRVSAKLSKEDKKKLQAKYDEEAKKKGKKKAKKAKGENMIPVVPISGWKGDNLIKPSTNMSWFKGWKAATPTGRLVKGVTIFEALDQFVEPVERDLTKPLRVPLSGVYKMSAGTVVTGRVEQGELLKEVKTKTGMTGTKVKFYPSGICGKVFSIEAHHRQEPKAVAGDNVGICIKGLPKGVLPKAGEVMVLHEEKGSFGKTKSFECEVKIQDHPGKLKVGYCPLALVRTMKAPCKITEIIWKVDKAGLKACKKKSELPNFYQKNPKHISAGEIARIKFEPQMPMSVTSQDECDGLGRVAILESNSLVMIGQIKTTTNEPVADRT